MLTPSGSAPASVPVGKEREAFGTQLSGPLLWTRPPDVQGQRPRCPGTQLTSCSIGLVERTGPEIVPHGQGLLSGRTGGPPLLPGWTWGPPVLPGWTGGSSPPPWMDRGILPFSLDGLEHPPLLPGWTWGPPLLPGWTWGSSPPPWMDLESSPPPWMDLGAKNVSHIFACVCLQGEGPSCHLADGGPLRADRFLICHSTRGLAQG